MGQHKPLASLSSSLLARKGDARPAMRRQGFGEAGTPVAAQDDLGWNDMGEGPSADVGMAMPPAPEQDRAHRPHPNTVRAELVEALPFLREKEGGNTVIRGADDAPAAAARPVSLATARRIGRETRAKHGGGKNGGEARSAFTLRLDSERHLKLRLASAVTNRSAQLLVIAALDAFLATLPEVGQLASQLPDRTAS